MVTRLIVACSVMALCVIIHAGGLTWALRQLRQAAARPLRFWTSTGLFILVAIWIVLLHLLESGAWASLYLWTGAMADLPSALYFSAVTCTTTGYGDLVLAKEWRLRRHRGAHRHPEVRLVDRVLLRDREPVI